MDQIPIRRALVSVSDKTGIVDFCRALAAHGAELISTGGTAKALRDAGLAVKDISEHTGFPEMLDGRVKTLHPKVHGGLLARRDSDEHLRAANEHGIALIDMVVVNLYPFEQTVANPEVTRENAIENIDIGGPSMVRSAAKNQDAVAVVTDPADYTALSEELGKTGGKLGLSTRRMLARKAFRLTAWYDHAIAEYLAHEEDYFAQQRMQRVEHVLATIPYREREIVRMHFGLGESPKYTLAEIAAMFHVSAERVRQLLERATRRLQHPIRNTDWPGRSVEPEDEFSQHKLVALKLRQRLRYGENPHQEAAFYAVGRHGEGLGKLAQLSGKELSYNNLLDLDAALRCASDFDEEPFAVVVKHTNPCGAAIGSSIAEAFARAYDCDPLSAFGGIVGLNRGFDFATAEQLIAGEKFIEAVVAPEFDPPAVEALVEKSKKKWRKSIRLVQASPVHSRGAPIEYRSVSGGMLAQQSDVLRVEASEIKVVTSHMPDSREMHELLFAWTLCRSYKSNAVVITAHKALLGFGAGQTSRVDATDHALQRAGEKARGAVLASDAFFPFPDSIEKAAKAGIAAIIQPGGSVRDDDVVKACNEHGVAMVFTGMRHFRH
jgi:phosphoribosylaminoimidazolecarboxamide formyltransferase/IMP cyclohydrolase